MATNYNEVAKRFARNYNLVIDEMLRRTANVQFFQEWLNEEQNARHERDAWARIVKTSNELLLEDAKVLLAKMQEFSATYLPDGSVFYSTPCDWLQEIVTPLSFEAIKQRVADLSKLGCGSEEFAAFLREDMPFRKTYELRSIKRQMKRYQADVDAGLVQAA